MRMEALQSMGNTIKDFRVRRSGTSLSSRAGQITLGDLPAGLIFHFHHEPDDVTRSAKLPILPGAGNLAEHVFVEIALGVPIFHRDLVDHVHNFSQQRGRPW